VSSITNIRMNQTGVSYDSLFGAYLKTAKQVKVVDPFIRYPYQVSNFLEFVQCARKNCDSPEELTIHLSTQNDEEKIPEMIDIFDDIKDDLAAHGIEFSYDFNADHDRYLELDNGWIITLGRGLDIYEKVARYSLDSLNQSERRCKEFNVTYNRNGGGRQ
jgi:ATP-dependent Lon protease